MALIPINSVGGYSTGLTMTAVIDATANITGVAGTFTGTFSGTTGSFSRLLTASAGFSAAGGVTLASPNLTGTPISTTAAVGTNTTQIATTAFVQNEIVADAVTGFNGRTGSVQGVSAAVAGTGISVSGATGSVTITNIGVQSFNGLTGDVGGVTTSAANTFTALQTFSSGISAAAGITFGATAAFRSSILLQNSEFIRNTTDGRIDFMPAPSSASAYGMYMDFTGWGFGTKLGTIRSSDNTTNVGSFLWDSALVIGNDVDFAFGANQAYKIRTTATNNNYKTLQLGLPAGTVGYSSALAIMDYAQSGSSLRQPNTVHTHPNVYIYSAGNASANDFIRIEHDRTNANIITGQTSGILIQPGSGFLGISGGISAAGATFSGTVALNGQTFTNVVSSVNGMSGSVGVVMGPVGFTSGSYRVFTYPDGVTTTGSKRPYYQSPFYAGRATSTAAVVANRTYFILQSAPAGLSLTSLRFSGANTGITGNCHFSVWSVSPSTGVPDQRLYVSASTTVGSAYAFTSVTNASGLVRVPGGLFYIAATFSSTPTIYTHPTDRSPHMFGSTDYTSGYNNYLPVIDTSGFTAPTSITQSGTTFGFIDYYPTQNPIPILEWQGL